MSKIIYLSLCLLLLHYAPIGVKAQINVDTTSTIQLSFARQNNFTYNTLLSTRLYYTKGKYSAQLSLSHSNIYNSLRQESPFVQFYYQANLWQKFAFNPNWEAVSWIESDQYFDSRNHRISAYAGISYKHKDFLTIQPLLGYSWDYRNNILDQGFSPAIIIKGRYRWPDGLQVENTVFARLKLIEPRQQRNISLRQNWAMGAGNNANIAFGFTAGSNEMDSYRGSTEMQIRRDTFAVERLISDTIAPYLSLRYELLPNLYWDSENRFSFTQRAFKYNISDVENERFNDLAFNQVDVFSTQVLSYAFKNLQTRLRYDYQYIGRRYELKNTLNLVDAIYERFRKRERLKDYFRKRHQLELQIGYRLNPLNQLQLTLHNRYLQYDTPTEGNFDDHDQLNYGFSASWRKTWSRKFTTNYSLIGNLRQYAFLFRQRSQDNYTQRNLRFGFDFNWYPSPKFAIEGKQLIYVNYNVKDFEDINQTNRSTRNLETLVEATYRASKSLQSKFYFYRKETHLAFLNWEAFAETPLDTNRIYIIEQLNEWQVLKNKRNVLFLDVGYKHFSQSRRLNTSMISLKNILTPINLNERNFQTGPKTQLRWEKPAPASLELSVWWQLQYRDFKFKEVEKFTSLSANYREEIIQNPITAFRPFVQLRMNISLL